MDNVMYRRNVFKTLSVKPAKAGLRWVARNTMRTNILHASIGLMTEANELVVELAPYLLGASQLTDQMRLKAFAEMGDISYYTAVLCKSLHVKLPSSGKKMKLKGMTRGAAIFQLFDACTTIGGLAKKSFYGPVVYHGEEPISSEGKSPVAGTVNVPPTEAMYAARNAQVKELLETVVVPMLWTLCFDLFEVPPSNVFIGNIAKLSKRYGEGFFQLSEAEERDTDEESAALESQTT